MVHIIVSTFFFICLWGADYSQIRGRKRFITAIVIFSYGGLAGILVSLGIQQIFPLGNVSFLIFKFILLVFSAVSLVYILFIEISLYSQIGSSGDRRVFRKGTYSVVRHPGFYPFLLFIFSLYLFNPERDFLFTGGALVLLNFITVCLEDLYFFPQIFKDYDDYKTSVPFLIPGRTKR